MTIQDGEPTVIAGQEYQCLKAVMSINGMEVNSHVYVRVKDGYGITINTSCSADTEQQKEEILQAFQSMR